MDSSDDETDEYSYSKQSDSSISLEKRKVSFYFHLFIQKMARMHQTRIIQRNLVYIVGMTIEDSDIQLLQSEEMFGKYGAIEKIVLGNNNNSTTHIQSTTIGM